MMLARRGVGPLRSGGGVMAATASQRLNVASRFAAALLGGYAFTFGFVAICSLAGLAAGLRFSDSQTLAWMLGVAVYLVALLWAFTPRSTSLVWGVLGGGGLVMGVAAWVLSRMIAS
jgi:hypothetical protein